MKSASALAVTNDDKAVALPVVVEGKNASSILERLELGSKMRIQFVDDYNERDIHVFMDMVRKAVLESDDDLVPFVNAALTAIDNNRRPKRALSVRVGEGFFALGFAKIDFATRLGMRLKLIELVPA